MRASLSFWVAFSSFSSRRSSFSSSFVSRFLISFFPLLVLGLGFLFQVEDLILRLQRGLFFMRLSLLAGLVHDTLGKFLGVFDSFR